jgi:hypothetical protein
VKLGNLHNIPFAQPLLFFIYPSFIITITALHFIGNEKAENLD